MQGPVWYYTVVTIYYVLLAVVTFPRASRETIRLLKSIREWWRRQRPH